MAEFFANYWWAILIAVAVVAFIVIASVCNNKKMKQSLLYLVTMAEKELKSGTGELKLQAVYNKFIEKFPILSTFVPYSTFTKMVDQALDKMEEMLKANEAINTYVNG